MSKEIDIIKMAAKSAGLCIRHLYEDSEASSSTADKVANQIILDAIQSHYPDDKIISEESGVVNTKNNDRIWYVDPLDGSKNFDYRLPYFCVSIAFSSGGILNSGGVYIPLTGELFWADDSHSDIFLNEGVAPQPHLPPDIVAVTRYDGGKVSGYPVRTGSSALDLVLTSMGNYKACHIRNVNAWDIAAGIVI